MTTISIWIVRAWMFTLPAGIQLDLNYAECRQLLNAALAAHDAEGLENVIRVCRVIDHRVEE